MAVLDGSISWDYRGIGKYTPRFGLVPIVGAGNLEEVTAETGGKKLANLIDMKMDEIMQQ